MFNMPTSGPLSPIVSLERRKLEQQGIPPGQEQQGSAAKGSPISGNLAQLIQLNRMIQQQGAMQQQANSAPSTVAQDLMQQVTQQRAPQMQPQMPPQMRQMAPQPDPRQQGIAQLPQEAVGNGMAAGGIVVFDEGGDVRHFDGLDGSLVGGLLNPGYGQDNVLTEALRQKAIEEEKAKRQAAMKAAMQRTAASGDAGLAEFVPTLSIPKRSALDVYARNAGIEADRTSAYYDKKRKEEEDASGWTGVLKKQQEEQDRLKAEASPEAKKKAFWNNLSAQLAGQIGQRGVSTGTRLAQMVGAVGGARSGTEEEFKKRNAELNKAANDLQEKQAMYRMTAMKADRKDAETAQKVYEKALIDKESAETKAKQEAVAEQRLSQQDRLRGRELDIQERRYKDQAAHEKAMQDITAGKDPQVKAAALLTSYTQQLNNLSALIRDPSTMEDTKTGYRQEYADTVQRLNEVRNLVGGGIGLSKASAAPTGNPLMDPSLIAAEKKRRGL
jgi:hypothetical protein